MKSECEKCCSQGVCKDYLGDEEDICCELYVPMPYRWYCDICGELVDMTGHEDGISAYDVEGKAACFQCWLKDEQKEGCCNSCKQSGNCDAEVTFKDTGKVCGGYEMKDTCDYCGETKGSEACEDCCPDDEYNPKPRRKG